MLNRQLTARASRPKAQGFACAALLTLVIASLLLTSCSGGSAMFRRPAGAQPVDIAAALAELDAMQPPEGADARVFQQLKDALAGALRKRAGKAASVPPRGAKNAVTDFAIYSESGQLRLSWHYRNNGDYDQDGVVGVSDITPIAMHWNEDAVDVNSIQGVIDGSGNEKVDIADITPIAQNFAVRCEGYLLQNAPSSGGTWNSIQSFDFSAGGGMERKIFYPLVAEGTGRYYRVRPFHGAEAGDPSNVVYYGGPPEPPVITSVTPTEGATGAQVEFTAGVTGTAPITVSWDFGGGATPNAPLGPLVTVTLGAVGGYTVNVWATNAAGTDNHQFTLAVNDVPPEAPVINSVSPQSGVRETLVQFTADVTGTPPLTYAWDFGGGAVPNVSPEASPSVMLAIASNNYNASLTVSNAVGDNTYDFTLSVTDVPIGPITVDSVGGDQVCAIMLNGSFPAIAYRRAINPPDDTSPTVFFVRALDAQGYTWGTPAEIPPAASGNYPGAHNSLADVNGYPAVTTSVGFMIEGGDVGFSLANDIAGSSWPSLSPIHTGSAVNPPPSSLYSINGFPAAAHTSSGIGGDLIFRSAKTANGSEWNDPITIVSSLLSSHANSVTLRTVYSMIAGAVPAIAVAGDNDLYYVRATSDDGSLWLLPPILVDSFVDTADMSVVAGLPAIAYVSAGELPRVLFFLRAEDDLGDTWNDGNRVAVDTEVYETGGRISMAVINGLPAIAYTSGSWDNCRLRYAIAKDAMGLEWETPVTIDPMTNAGNTASLIQSGQSGFNARPAIAYSYRNPLGSDTSIRYIRADDSLGLSWPE